VERPDKKDGSQKVSWGKMRRRAFARQQVDTMLAAGSAPGLRALPALAPRPRAAPAPLRPRSLRTAAAAVETAGDPALVVVFDNSSDPKSTVISVKASNRPGVLHAITTTFNDLALSVNKAEVDMADGLLSGELRGTWANTTSPRLTLPQTSSTSLAATGGRSRTRRTWRTSRSACARACAQPALASARECPTAADQALC